MVGHKCILGFESYLWFLLWGRLPSVRAIELTWDLYIVSKAWKLIFDRSC